MDEFKAYIRSGGHAPLPATAQTDALLADFPWFATARVVRALTDENAGGDVLLGLHLSACPAPAGRLLEVSADELRQVGAAVEASDAAVDMPVNKDVGMDAQTVPEDALSAEERIIERFLGHGDYRIVPAHDAAAEEDAAPGPEAPEGFALPEIVTEQLANIYLKQELWPQAKAAYEKLSLLYPKKSVYFAEIIEQINSRTQGRNN